MRFEGGGIVWDKERGRALCRFSNGVFETDDPYIIKKLQEAGYGGQTIEGDGKGPALAEKPFNELREAAKSKKVTGYSRMNKQQLIDALKEVKK